MRGVKIAAIQAGGAICLPVILVGQIMGERFGTFSALIGLTIGSGILLLLGLGVAKLTHHLQLNTVELARYLFGKKGVIAFTILYLLIKGGWFAIGLNLMGQSLEIFIGGDHLLYNFLLGLGAVGVVLAGIKGVGRMAAWSLPLLMGTLLVAPFIMKGNGVLVKGPFSLDPISMVVAASISPLFNLPTFLIHARSYRDTKVAILLIFGIILPLIEGAGIYLGKYSTQFLQTGHLFWDFWVTLFMVLAGWTTLNNNLYSAGVGLKVLFPQKGAKKGVFLLGCIGIGLSLTPMLDAYPLLLNLLGTSSGAFGGVMLAQFFLFRGQAVKQPLPFLCWAIGGICGSLTSLQVFTISGIPVLDAMGIGGGLLALYGVIQLRLIAKKDLF